MGRRSIRVDLNPAVTFFAALFTNNILLANFLGMCPFLACSTKVKAAAGLGAAVIFVLTCTAPLNYMVYRFLLVPLGLDYLRYADLKIVLDNLIHRLEIPAMIVALTQSPDRLVEYTGDERHARFLSEDLLSAVAAKFPLLDDRNARGVVGASFGGVAALPAATRARPASSEPSTRLPPVRK